MIAVFYPHRSSHNEGKLTIEVRKTCKFCFCKMYSCIQWGVKLSYMPGSGRNYRDFQYHVLLAVSTQIISDTMSKFDQIITTYIITSISFYTLFLHLQTFEANTDDDTPVTITFPKPVRTRLLRIRPTSWKSWCSLRLEVLGCAIGKIDGTIGL